MVSVDRDTKDQARKRKETEKENQEEKCAE
jgi:hypothetical protein